MNAWDSWWRRRKQSFRWSGAVTSMNSLQPGSSGGEGDEGGGERSRDGFSTKLKSPQRMCSSSVGSVFRKFLSSWEKKCFLSEGFAGA